MTAELSKTLWRKNTSKCETAGGTKLARKSEIRCAEGKKLKGKVGDEMNTNYYEVGSLNQKGGLQYFTKSWHKGAGTGKAHGDTRMGGKTF